MSNEAIIAIAVSAFFGFIAIIQSWRIHKYNKINKIRKSIEFYYEIKNSLSLSDIPYNLSIQHKSKPYEHIFLVEGIIGSKGNIVFTDSDLLKPLKLRSREQIEFLEYEIIDKTKDVLECDLIIDIDNGTNCIKVIANNFEPKDAFKFRMLIASNKNELELELDGLIKDENSSIKPISKEIDEVNYRMAAEGGGMDESGCGLIAIILLGILIGFYFLFIWIQGLFYSWLKDELRFTISSSEVLSFILGLTVIAGFVTLVIIISKKLKIGQKLSQKGKDSSLTGFGPWFDLRIRTKNMFDHID